MSIRAAIGRPVIALGKKIAGKDEPSNDKPPKDDDSETPITLKAPWWVIVLTIGGAVVLVVAGLLVLREGREIWVKPGAPQVAEPPTTETERTIRAPAARDGERRTTTTTTRERASQGGGRSEALALAILATGAGLLLAGGFASRLTSIKLPGGVEMMVAAAYTAGTTDGAASTAKAAVAAKKKGREDVLQDEKKLAEAGRKALHFEPSERLMRAVGGEVRFRPAVDDAEAEAAVDQVSEQVTPKDSS